MSTTSVDSRSPLTRVAAARRRVAAWLADGRAKALEISAGPRARLAPVTSVVTPAARMILVLVLVSAVAAMQLDWTEARFAAFFGSSLLLVCALFVLGAHHLAADLDLTRDRVVVGERANGRLLLTNSSSRRVLPMTIELPVGTSRADFALPSLAAGAEHEELFAIPTARRAILDVGPVHAVRSDPFGLLRRDQELTDVHLLHVHPRTVRITGSATGFVRDLEGQTVKKLSDSDVAFHALRGYVPGDDLRYVHWKTSARTGTLMVRQFEETRRSHLLVALSTRLDDYANDDEFELAVSVAGSLGVQTISDGQTLSAATSTSHLRSDHATLLLDQLSGVDYDTRAPRLPEAVRRLAREVHGASVAVVVCGSLVDAAELRRAARYLPLDVRSIVVRSDVGSDATLRKMADVDLATLGALDDLPSVIRRLSA